MIHRIALVHRPLWMEMQDDRLGADAEAAGERVVAIHRCLEVHQPLLELVVRAVERLGVLDAADADPRAAVERLHVQRHPDGAGDRLEVEIAQVSLRGPCETGVVRRRLVGQHPRLGNLEPEADHGAVRGVLLHRLERERVVEEMDAIHEHDLLQPLSRHRVPPAQAVDHQRMARLHAQVEGLDGDALGGELMRLTAFANREVGTPQQRLERRPASPPPRRATCR